MCLQILDPEVPVERLAALTTGDGSSPPAFGPPSLTRIAAAALRAGLDETLETIHALSMQQEKGPAIPTSIQPLKTDPNPSPAPHSGLRQSPLTPPPGPSLLASLASPRRPPRRAQSMGNASGMDSTRVGIHFTMDAAAVGRTSRRPTSNDQRMPHCQPIIPEQVFVRPISSGLLVQEARSRTGQPSRPATSPHVVSGPIPSRRISEPGRPVTAPNVQHDPQGAVVAYLTDAGDRIRALSLDREHRISHAHEEHGRGTSTSGASTMMQSHASPSTSASSSDWYMSVLGTATLAASSTEGPSASTSVDASHAEEPSRLNMQSAAAQNTAVDQHGIASSSPETPRKGAAYGFNEQGSPVMNPVHLSIGTLPSTPEHQAVTGCDLPASADRKLQMKQAKAISSGLLPAHGVTGDQAPGTSADEPSDDSWTIAAVPSPMTSPTRQRPSGAHQPRSLHRRALSLGQFSLSQQMSRGMSHDGSSLRDVYSASQHGDVYGSLVTEPIQEPIGMEVDAKMIEVDGIQGVKAPLEHDSYGVRWSDDGGLCGICCDGLPSVSIQPCKHQACAGCMKGLIHLGSKTACPSCPFCRRDISGLTLAVE